MSAVPSIKGTIFAGLVEQVNKLLADGTIEKSDLGRWLSPVDIELLRRTITIASWYDIQSYVRLNSLLLEVVGHGDIEFLREQGRATAKRLLDAGLYSQFEYLTRPQFEHETRPKERYAAFGRDLRRLNTLSASILNFSKWQQKNDPDHDDRYILEVSEAEDYPDVLAWRTEGFINGMAAVHGDGNLWIWERVAPDRIEFRMIRAI